MADDPTRGGLLDMLSNPDTFRDAAGNLNYSSGVPVDLNPTTPDNMFAPVNYMSPTTNPWNDPSNPYYNPRVAATVADEAQTAHETSIPNQVALQQRHTDAAEGHGWSAEDLAFMDQGLISPWGEPAGYSFGPYYGDSGRYSGTPLDGAGLDFSNSTSGIPGNWQDFYTPNNRSTGGGFFTLSDAFGGDPEKVPAMYGRSGKGPSAGDAPSTNNWRLLPGSFRRPGHIMRNGYIINAWGRPGAADNDFQLSHSGLNLPDYAPGFPGWQSSSGRTISYGWPGSYGQWTAPTEGVT